jgi:mono/diheme cytochrome c family protein
MRVRAFFFVSLFLGFPCLALAQQSGSTPPVLNDTQILGRRIFQQRCGVCHTETTPGARQYGPAIFKELVVGNEDSIRQIIQNGSSDKMPGFKYGLEPAEINAIVEYLKTVPRPKPAAPRGGGGEAGPMVD